MMRVRAYHYIGENKNLGEGTTEYLLFIPVGEEELNLADPYRGFELHSVSEIEVPDDFPTHKGMVYHWSL